MRENCNGRYIEDRAQTKGIKHNAAIIQLFLSEEDTTWGKLIGKNYVNDIDAGIADIIPTAEHYVNVLISEHATRIPYGLCMWSKRSDEVDVWRLPETFHRVTFLTRRPSELANDC